MRRFTPGTPKEQCVKCFSTRHVKTVNGPGIPPTGMRMCRSCTQGYKMILKLRQQQADGHARAEFEKGMRKQAALIAAKEAV